MDCAPKVLSEATYRMYKDMIFNCVLEGWVTIWPKFSAGTVIEGYYNPNYGLCQDKMWAQGFYGTFLALDWRNTKDPRTLDYMVNFVNAIETMLGRTNGIYLRDNTAKAGSLYNSFRQQGNLAAEKDLEISRDQIIGLTAALYMIYCYVDESAAPDPADKQKISSLKQIIGQVFSNLENMFKEHESPFNYLLYNELEDRELGNYPNCWAFKPALKLAFDRVRRGTGAGVCARVGDVGDEKEITLDKLISYIGHLGATRDSAAISRVEGKAVGLLKGLSIPYFNWNLVMYFLLIAGLESKTWAKVAVAFIDAFVLLGFKHMNLAAVYCCLVSKWNLKGLFLKRNKTKNQFILAHDWYLFPDAIVPCSLAAGDPQWGSRWPAPVNATWWWKFDSICQDPSDDNDQWCTPPPAAARTNDDIREAGKKGDVEIDCGLSLLFRNLLYNFKP